MKKFYLSLLLILLHTLSNSQPVVGRTEETRDLYASAKKYLHAADYANAIMVFNQVIQLEPDNLIYRKELAKAYYQYGDLAKAERMIVPLLKQDEADEETFQLATKILAGMKKDEDAKDAINKGIQRYPNAGVLYLEKGNLLTDQKKFADAAKAWEKGIQKDPRFHLNYYNLAKVYFFTKKYIWAIYYGEMFVNMESFSAKSSEIKKIVFEGYKFLMAELNNIALDGKVGRYQNATNFETALLSVYDNLRNVVTGGINIDNLIMLRTRFLIDWNKQFATTYPNELFDYQQRMLLQGYYDCYNQWYFGRLQDEKQFATWTQTHNALMNKFDKYYRANKLQPKDNQYYHMN